MLFLWERSTTRNVSAQTVLDPARLVGSKAVCIETFGVLHLSLQTQHTGHPRHRIQGRKCSSLVLEGPKPGLWTEVRPVQRHREWPPSLAGAVPWCPRAPATLGPPKGPLSFRRGFLLYSFLWPPLTPPQKIAIDRQKRKKNSLDIDGQKNN